MGQQVFPFQPAATAANTSNIVVTTVNQTFTLSPSVGADGGTIRLANIGTQIVFVVMGTVNSSVTTSMPMLPNSVETFSMPGGLFTLSVIAPATGSTLYCTIGIGL